MAGDSNRFTFGRTLSTLSCNKINSYFVHLMITVACVLQREILWKKIRKPVNSETFPKKLHGFALQELRPTQTTVGK